MVWKYTTTNNEQCLFPISQPAMERMDVPEHDEQLSSIDLARTYVRGSGPLPSLEDALVADELVRLQQQRIGVFIPRDQSFKEFTAYAEFLVADPLRLQGVLKVREGDNVLTENSLLLLLSDACAQKFPEHYDGYLLVQFLLHPNATPAVIDAVFSYALDDFLRPELLAQVVSFDMVYRHALVERFLVVMQEKFSSYTTSFAYHADAWKALATLGEWTTTQRQSVLQELEHTTVLHTMMCAAFEKNTTEQRLGVSSLDAYGRTDTGLAYVSTYVKELGEKTPITFLRKALEIGCVDVEILQCLQPTTVYHAVMDMFYEGISVPVLLWDTVLPYLGAHLSVAQLLSISTTYTDGFPRITEEILELCAAAPETYRPFVGTWFACVLEKGEFSSVINLLPAMCAVTQKQGQLAICNQIWDTYAHEMTMLYRTADTQFLSRQMLLRYFHTHLFAAGEITTFTQLNEVYDAVPVSPEKTFILLSLFIRSGAEYRALDALDTYLFSPTACSMLTQEQQHILQQEVGMRKSI